MKTRLKLAWDNFRKKHYGAIMLSSLMNTVQNRWPWCLGAPILRRWFWLAPLFAQKRYNLSPFSCLTAAPVSISVSIDFLNHIKTLETVCFYLCLNIVRAVLHFSKITHKCRHQMWKKSFCSIMVLFFCFGLDSVQI